MRKKLRGRLLGFMLVACLTTGLCMSVSAHGYDFTFRPPFAGCAKETSRQDRSGATPPYVSPAGATANTTYCLRDYGTVVSNYITTGTAGRKNFTYNSGYEYLAEGNLLGYPQNHDFLQYRVYGTWGP